MTPAAYFAQQFATLAVASTIAINAVSVFVSQGRLVFVIATVAAILSAATAYANWRLVEVKAKPEFIDVSMGLAIGFGLLALVIFTLGWAVR